MIGIGLRAIESPDRAQGFSGVKVLATSAVWSARPLAMDRRASKGRGQGGGRGKGGRGKGSGRAGRGERGGKGAGRAFADGVSSQLRLPLPDFPSHGKLIILGHEDGGATCGPLEVHANGDGTLCFFHRAAGGFLRLRLDGVGNVKARGKGPATRFWASQAVGSGEGDVELSLFGVQSGLWLALSADGTLSGTTGSNALCCSEASASVSGSADASAPTSPSESQPLASPSPSPPPPHAAPPTLPQKVDEESEKEGGGEEEDEAFSSSAWWERELRDAPSLDLKLCRLHPLEAYRARARS